MTNSNETDSHRRVDATGQYQHTFDPAVDSVSEELVYAVAELDDTEPTELAILADVVDPDALDSLFQSRSNGRPRDANGLVVFTYDSHLVEITADGSILISSDESSNDD